MSTKWNVVLDLVLLYNQTSLSLPVFLFIDKNSSLGFGNV